MITCTDLENMTLRETSQGEKDNGAFDLTPMQNLRTSNSWEREESPGVRAGDSQMRVRGHKISDEVSRFRGSPAQ